MPAPSSSTAEPGWLSTRTLLSICAVVPILFLFSPSYIHPDELFQGQEVLLAAREGRYANIPWEFADTQTPSRSIVPPAIFVGLPMALWAALTGEGGLEMEPFVARAGVTLMMSLFAFPTATRLAKESALSPGTVALLLATSWVGVIMMGRPFSNSSESLMLLALLAAYCTFRRKTTTALAASQDQASRRSSRLTTASLGLLIGCLGAFGLFVRFTFAVFALPLAALAAIELVLPSAFSSSGARAASPSTFRISHAAIFAGAVAVGALTSGASLLAVDSVFFGGSSSLTDAFFAMASIALSFVKKEAGNGTPFAFSKLRLAPYNNFLYNLDPSNLALHGLHPRWLHLAVNGHLMYGPLWLPALMVALWTVVVKPLKRFFGSKSNRVEEDQSETEHASPSSFLLVWSSATLLFSLFVVSTAPHQEPRFLAPLVWPVCFLGAFFVDSALPALQVRLVALVGHKRHCLPMVTPPSLKAVFWSLWIVFNVLLARLFGGLHQAHVPSSAAAIGRAFSSEAGISISSSYNPLHSALQAYLSQQQQQQDMRVQVHYVGTYMVPYTAAGLSSPVLMKAKKAAGVIGLQAAPWASLPSQQVVKQEGGVVQQGGATRTLQFYEHNSFEDEKLLSTLKNSKATASTNLLVYPSTIAGHAEKTAASSPCSVKEIYRQPRFLSTENAPETAEGWLSALFLFPPFDSLFEAVVGRPPEIPSLVFAAWSCQGN